MEIITAKTVSPLVRYYLPTPEICTVIQLFPWRIQNMGPRVGKDSGKEPIASDPNLRRPQTGDPTSRWRQW